MSKGFAGLFMFSRDYGYFMHGMLAALKRAMKHSILLLAAIVICSIAHAEPHDPSSGALSADPGQQGGDPVAVKRSPALVSTVEHPGCVEVRLSVPNQGKLGDKQLLWHGLSSGGLSDQDDTNLRTKDIVDGVSWNNDLKMTLSMPGIRKKLGSGTVLFESEKLYNYNGDDHSIYGSFLLLQHLDQLRSKQYGENTAFDAMVFYVDGDANLPRKATVDCQQMSWFDPTAMEWGKCYWLSGDAKDPSTGKPYCW
jgi:hypothetical protein